MHIMRFSIFSIALLPLVLTAPAPEVKTKKSPNFTVLTLRSGSPIHFNQIGANNGLIFLNSATTYCPLAPKNCPTDAITAFYVETPSNTSYLANEVGAQQLFVNASTGVVGYTIPTVAPPHGATTKGFYYTPQGTGPAGQGTFGFLPYGLIACSVGTTEDGPFQVFAQVPDFKQPGQFSCLGFDTAASNISSAGAYVYTNTLAF